jgi:hypothetical protein
MYSLLFNKIHCTACVAVYCTACTALQRIVLHCIICTSSHNNTHILMSTVADCNVCASICAILYYFVLCYIMLYYVILHSSIL